MTAGRAFGRRRFLAAGGAALATFGVAPAALANEPQTLSLPWAVYMPEGGHHVPRPLLDWWLQHGREQVIGWPVTPAIATPIGVQQFFSHGALATDPSSPDPLGVVALDVGSSWWERITSSRSDMGPEELESGYDLDDVPYSIHPAFWPSFRETGGVSAFGNPLGWARVIDGRLTQPFERAVFTEGSRSVARAPVAAWEAEAREFPIGRRRQLPFVPTYDAAMVARPFATSGARSAEVDLRRQVATFFVDDEPVYESLVSTGEYPHFTPIGTHRIFVRHERTRMRELDTDTPSYDYSDVLYVQYFTDRWIGFHYAYWHDEFGVPSSGGCVNMRLDDAQWAWNFCGHGTSVFVLERSTPAPVG